MLLKDNIATGDQMHTTAGAYALRNWQADRDATIVQKLRAAGAIILGKANLSEWANYMDPCMPSGFSVVGGQTRHPYGPFDPMGSSSGSAVSVGANLTAVSVGSETSGSLIQPARSNSVAALRPSLGLLSRDHIIPLGPDLDTPGPMGRSVTDVAIMLNVMSGADENDPKTAGAAALNGVDFTQFLSLDQAKKLRVGVIIPSTATALVQQQAKMLEQVAGKSLSEAEVHSLLVEYMLPSLGGDPATAIDALKQLGIEVVEIDETTLPPSGDTAQVQLPYSFNAGVADLFGELPSPAPIASLAEVVAINNEDLANRAPYGQLFLEKSVSNTTTAEEYVRIRAVAQALAQNWMKTVLETNNVDILVSGMSYSGNAGAAGVPALTIPAGLDPKGEPQGIVLSGDYLSEPKLFAVGYALEQVLQGRVEPDLAATIAEIEAVSTRMAKPEAVSALETAYGAPSQAGFGSAVFYEPLAASADLEQAALAKYRFFVGDAWERFGEDAWMGPWQQVYGRPEGAAPDIVTELRGLEDRDAASSAALILDDVDNAESARAALAAVFDDPAVTEVAAYRLGDGAAMSGLLVAGRLQDQNAVYLVFLLD
ncbi:MAG: hypothetical protein IPK16_14535 [Anaerolineales bacterium]|nr:hypothetical protein [Anaerolineales bacterium]